MNRCIFVKFEIQNVYQLGVWRYWIPSCTLSSIKYGSHPSPASYCFKYCHNKQVRRPLVTLNASIMDPWNNLLALFCLLSPWIEVAFFYLLFSHWILINLILLIYCFTLISSICNYSVSVRMQLILFNNWFMVFNATFNNISVISCRSALLVEETEVPGENHRPVSSRWQTLSYIT